MTLAFKTLLAVLFCASLGFIFLWFWLREEPEPAEAPEPYDETPWCHCCGARTEAMCRCGPIAEND